MFFYILVILLLCILLFLNFYKKDYNDKTNLQNEDAIKQALTDIPSKNSLFNPEENEIKNAMNKAILFNDNPYDITSIKKYLTINIEDDILKEKINEINNKKLFEYNRDFINSFGDYNVDYEQQIKDYDIKNYKDDLFSGEIKLNYLEQEKFK